MKDVEMRLLPEPVQDYLLYTEAIKGHSHLTVLEYASDLRTFFRYLFIVKGLVSPDTSIDDIDISGVDISFIKTVTLNDAYSFMIYCKNERKNNEATRARKVISIRRFFRYLSENKGQLESNPMKQLDIPKIKKALPKYLTLEESIHFLNVISGPTKERDYCIITIFLNCGLRLSELVSIDYTAIDSDNTLTVLGKGNKERKVYLNDACVAAIRNYMRVRPVDGVKREDKKALFLSSRLQRISPKTVQYIVNTYLDKAGFGGRGLSVHKLRHTAATLMYQHGHVDVLVLKEILGHENLGTTEIYTHIGSQQSKEAVRSNPLSRQKAKE